MARSHSPTASTAVTPSSRRGIQYRSDNTVKRPGVSGGSDVPWVSRSRDAGVWSCYGFGFTESEFVFDRGEHAEGGVAPAPVVEDLQVLKQGVGELQAGAPALPVQELGLD